MENLLAGILLGLMGSVHCIGMCGPLVMSIHTRNGQNKSNIGYQAAYHFGKITAYLIIGLIFGSIGQSLHVFLSQQKLSILLGIGFILYFLFSHFKFGNSSYLFASKLTQVSRFFTSIVEQKSLPKLFLSGLGNGFLPCGLVYTAASASIASGHWETSLWFMFGFGLGTIPSLTSVVYLVCIIPNHIRSFLSYFYKYLVLIVGILLILRGLNLGIPYISPAMNAETEEVHSCCHKE